MNGRTHYLWALVLPFTVLALAGERTAKQDASATFKRQDITVENFKSAGFYRDPKAPSNMVFVMIGTPRLLATFPTRGATIEAGSAMFVTDSSTEEVKRGTLAGQVVTTLASAGSDGGQHITTLNAPTVYYTGKGTKALPGMGLDLVAGDSSKPSGVRMTSTYAAKHQSIVVTATGGHFEFVSTSGGKKEVEIESGILRGPVTVRYNGLRKPDDPSTKTDANATMDRAEISRDHGAYVLTLIGHVHFTSNEGLDFREGARGYVTVRLSSQLELESVIPSDNSGLMTIPPELLKDNGPVSSAGSGGSAR